MEKHGQVEQDRFRVFLYGITYGPAGGYVAIGTDGTNSIYLTSPDGETWTGGTGPIQGYLNGITYDAAGGYVAVGSISDGSSLYLTSPDGETWTGGTGPVQGSLRGVAYDSTGGYVASINSNSNITTSRIICNSF